MKLAIQTEVRGKPKGGMWQMGYGWENIEVDSWEEAFELFTVEGYSQTCELWNDNRKRENFLSRQIILIDADKEMFIKDLWTDDFYNKYGAGFYTSPSHSDVQDKFRICFVVETAFTDVDKCQSFIHALRKYFYPKSDKQPTNPASYFNGTPNCLIKECRNKIVPNEVVDTMIALYDKEQEEEWEAQIVTQTTNYVQYDYDTIFVEELLNRIQSFDHQLIDAYDKFVEIAWATCHVVGVNNGEALMRRYWPLKTKTHIKSLRAYKPHLNKHKVGTLIHHAKLKGTEDLRQLELEFKQRNILNDYT
tara:strand:- start:47 stop:961 length:915 start_codon:yes stop_codon:yes gene_type:complete